VISSDLSHYEPYERARTHDAATAAAIERLEFADLAPRDACGWLPIAGLLMEAGRRGMRVERLDLRNSGDTAGPRDRVVGYGAWAFHQP
jgi:MEMO1 family protein